uniref:Ribosomal protein L20 n=1 Tax=Plocamiocolax pulvinatus TaxID=35206 RepID=E5Q3H2_9FLOR|nr:ribosomal protein L20 [Plocamiocolax pulvinata]ADR03255.1 ribosomal protein L20 [Plocamiocolax pulvinata]
MKKEVFQTKSRKIKKRSKYKTYIQHLNFLSYFYYNLYIYFFFKKNLLLNRKILSNFYIKEIGSLISLQKWVFDYYVIEWGSKK